MADRILVSGWYNSCWFTEAINNRLNVITQSDFQHQILPFQQRVNYFQKSITSDLISLQFHINNGYTALLYVTDIRQKVVAAIDLNAAPTVKGVQVITGNDYIDPFTSVVTPLRTWQWAFNWVDFIADLVPDKPDSIYYIKLVVNDGSTDKEYYSEPILLRTSVLDYWDWEIGIRNTIYIEAQYNSNRAQNTNVVVGGWFSDFGAGPVPWVFQTAQRVEGYVLPMDMKAVNLGYLQQNYNQLFISGQQVPMRVLKIGELSTGIPDYLLQMVTELLLADTFFINGTWYKISGGSSQAAPADMWKSKRDDNYPLLYANTVITLGDIRQQAMKTPPLLLPDRVFTGEFDDTFS